MNSRLGSVCAYAMPVGAYRMAVGAFRVVTERHLCVCTACTPLYQVEVLGTKGRRTVILNTKNIAANCVGLGMLVRGSRHGGDM